MVVLGNSETTEWETSHAMRFTLRQIAPRDRHVVDDPVKGINFKGQRIS